MMLRPARFRSFLGQMSALVEGGGEAEILAHGPAILSALVSHDDWLPEECARPDPDRYQQYLLHCDAQERFSVVSFVWGVGQSTPIHDHTTWGLIGMLRGAETSQPYRIVDGEVRPHGEPATLRPGDVETLSPSVGDIHKVVNANPGAPSISIHVYGRNIGAVRRSVFEPGGIVKPFVSGFSNTQVPNFWDVSKDPAGAGASQSDGGHGPSPRRA